MDFVSFEPLGGPATRAVGEQAKLVHRMGGRYVETLETITIYAPPDHFAGDTKRQSTIGAGADLQPLIRPARQTGLARINHDQLCAGLLRGNRRGGMGNPDRRMTCSAWLRKPSREVNNRQMRGALFKSSVTNGVASINCSKLSKISSTFK